MRPLAGLPENQQGADRKDRALDGDQRRQRRPSGIQLPAGESDDRQAGCRHDQASPLPAAEVKAKEALGENSEEYEPAGEDRLHDRQRRERQRSHVQQPRTQGDEPADRPPSPAEQAGRAEERMKAVHRWSGYSPALLEQEGSARGNRRGQGKDKSYEHNGT